MVWQAVDDNQLPENYEEDYLKTFGERVYPNLTIPWSNKDNKTILVENFKTDLYPSLLYKDGIETTSVKYISGTVNA